PGAAEPALVGLEHVRRAGRVFAEPGWRREVTLSPATRSSLSRCQLQRLSIQRYQQLLRRYALLGRMPPQFVARDGGMVERFHVGGDHGGVRRQPAGRNGFRGVLRDEIAVPSGPAGMDDDDLGLYVR